MKEAEIVVTMRIRNMIHHFLKPSFIPKRSIPKRHTSSLIVDAQGRDTSGPLTDWSRTTIPALRVLHARMQADKFQPTRRISYTRIIDQVLEASHE